MADPVFIGVAALTVGSAISILLCYTSIIRKNCIADVKVLIIAHISEFSGITNSFISPFGAVM
jgi:hypothetical protein